MSKNLTQAQKLLYPLVVHHTAPARIFQADPGNFMRYIGIQGLVSITVNDKNDRAYASIVVTNQNDCIYAECFPTAGEVIARKHSQDFIFYDGYGHLTGLQFESNAERNKFFDILMVFVDRHVKNDVQPQNVMSTNNEKKRQNQVRVVRCFGLKEEFQIKITDSGVQSSGFEFTQKQLNRAKQLLTQLNQIENNQSQILNTVIFGRRAQIRQPFTPEPVVTPIPIVQRSTPGPIQYQITPVVQRTNPHPTPPFRRHETIESTVLHVEAIKTEKTKADLLGDAIATLMRSRKRKLEVGDEVEM